MPQYRLIPNWLLIAVLLVSYFAAAKLGLMLAGVHPSATAVWPPSGIALAALLRLGHRVWPGIFVGAFLANITTAGSAATSLGIATGNTLEGLAGAYLVSRFCGGSNAFDRAEDVFKFAFLAAILSTSVSATIGVTSLALGGYAEWSDYGAIWFAWWLGDAGGDLVVAPLLILWSVNPRIRWHRNQLIEVSLLLLSLAVSSQVVFGGWSPIRNPLPLLYVPVLLWAAFRFGPRETVTLTFLTGAVGIWGTLRGVGPFVREPQNESFLLLAFFMCIVAVTAMAVAAAVSERKRVEETLGGGEGRLRLAMAAGRMGAWEWNIRTNRVAWSPSLEEIHGLEHGTFGGGFEHFKRDIHPEDVESVLAQIESTLKTRTDYHCAYRIKHPNGDVRWLEAFGRLALGADGQPEKLVGVCMDSTERKGVEAVLSSRLEQQAAVAALGVRALGSTDLATLMNEAVAEVARALGVEYCTVLELLPNRKALLARAGAGWHEGYVGHETVSAGTDSAAGYALESGGPVIVADLSTDIRFKAPLLRSLKVISGATVIIHGTDQPYGVLAAHTTRRRDFGRDDVYFLQAVANVLATAIGRQRSEEQLQRYAAGLESFSYRVALDLRSPLLAVAGLSQMVLKNLAKRMDLANLTHMRSIVDHTEKMDGLIQGLLAYGRFIRVGLKPEQLSVQSILPEVLNRLKEEVRRSGARFDLQEPLPEVLADRVTVVEIFRNLLSNAIKFVKPGVSPRIRVWAEEKGDFVRVWVEDNGIGIAREDHERVFRLFERLHRPGAYPGNGIGLAIVDKGVEWMGGQAGVESELGKGSRFWFELPTPR